jgi:ribosome-binding protein aMBF1 (putative translation factor)
MYEKELKEIKNYIKMFESACKKGKTKRAKTIEDLIKIRLNELLFNFKHCKITV